jgi:hypothetical protein
MRRSALVGVPTPAANMRRAFCVLIVKLGAVHSEVAVARQARLEQLKVLTTPAG